jgi:hypothetical protein
LKKFHSAKTIFAKLKKIHSRKRERRAEQQLL